MLMSRRTLLFLVTMLCVSACTCQNPFVKRKVGLKVERIVKPGKLVCLDTEDRLRLVLPNGKQVEGRFVAAHGDTLTIVDERGLLHRHSQRDTEVIVTYLAPSKTVRRWLLTGMAAGLLFMILVVSQQPYVGE